MDGALEYIKAIENNVNSKCMTKNYNILFCKYAAACNMTQSPNDKGFMHAILHNEFKNCKYSDKPESESRNGLWNRLKIFLQKYINK